MKKLKSQKGAISLFVILAMLFFLAFMLGIYSVTSRRNAAQIEAVRETAKIYSMGIDPATAYDSMVSVSDGSIIPIATVEQLQMLKKVTESGVESEVNYTVNGKIYTYKKYIEPPEGVTKKNVTYVLNNDIIIDMNSESYGIDGKADIEIYDYMLYNKTKYNINMNNHNIYYRMQDGSLWKCVFYQNTYAKGTHKDGNLSEPNYFTKADIEPELLKTALKSSEPRLYSSMEAELAGIKNKNGYVEFLLAYNCGVDQKFDLTNGVYNRWRQSVNPVDAKNTGIEWFMPEYQGISIGLNSEANENSWGGLSMSTATEDAYFDGSNIDVDCYYTVGAIKRYDDPDMEFDGIRVSDFTNEHKVKKSANQCILFARVDNTRPDAVDKNIIPISTLEQLETLRAVTEGEASEKTLVINGEEYVFKSKAADPTITYRLNNDIILDMQANLANSTMKIYDYMLYDTDKYKIDKNGHDIYYRLYDSTPATGYSKSSIWKCVFYQNCASDTDTHMYLSEAEAKRSLTPNKYSMLDAEIEPHKHSWPSSPNNYEFLLAYNNGTSSLFDFNNKKYQRWRQRQNPTTITDTNGDGSAKVEGYEGIHTGLGTDNYWGGLIKSSTTATYLDGSVGHSNWFYAVGVYKGHRYGTNGMPTSGPSGDSASRSLLFIRER